MSTQLISILALGVGFLVATVRSVNMGMVMLAIAFLVGAGVAGLDADKILVGFPSDLFVVLVGVTYLFAIARVNGTLDWLVQHTLPLIGGRIAYIPWVMFTVAGILTAVGAVSPAAVAMIAPIALRLADDYRINPLLMGTMVIHGAQAGSFSPVSVQGTIVNGVLKSSSLEAAPGALFLGSLAVNALIAAIVFVAFGGLRLIGTRTGTPPATPAFATAASANRTATGGSSGASAGPTEVLATGGAHEALTLDGPRVLTLVGLVALVVATLGFDYDVGLVAVTISVILSITFPSSVRDAPKEVPWPVVLLICGVLTYIGVLEQMGTIDYVSKSVTDVGVPLLGALLLCYIGGLVSAFASSTALLGALIPIAVPFLHEGDVGVVGFVVALSVSVTVVDVSPFSTNGAIVVANAATTNRDSLLRQLMIYCAAIVVLAPVMTWLVFVVVGG